MRLIRFARSANFWYNAIVPNQRDHIDNPEPRWQALRAFVAVGGIYLALPSSLIVGPTWMLPSLILILLIPTVIAHRTGRRSLNRALGLLINAIITIALIGSVILLVRALPSHREAPLQLLFSGGLLWLTSVLVFALWYWRLDGGGPTLRHERKEFGSRSFLFPQMQIPTSPLAPGRPEHDWMAVKTDSIGSRMSGGDLARRIRINPEFAHKVYDLLAPGATIVVTDAPEVRKTPTGRDFVILDD
jgi:hypothetical protein